MLFTVDRKVSHKLSQQTNSLFTKLFLKKNPATFLQKDGNFGFSTAGIHSLRRTHVEARPRKDGLLGLPETRHRNDAARWRDRVPGIRQPENGEDPLRLPLHPGRRW
mgnify:CR=1 FL=1